MTARALAISRIARAARHFPDIRLRGGETDDREGLDARDAALASAIEHQVLRRWLTLSALIESQLSRPWAETETKLQAALLCGAAQLLLMDRLPDYAVIDETVDWAKSNIRAKAGGLVNAVLRKVAALRGDAIEQPGSLPLPLAVDRLPLHDGRALQLTSAAFAADSLTRLSQQTSTPLELLEHWIRGLGMDAARMLAGHALVHAPMIVHGLEAGLAAQNRMRPHEQAGFFVLDAHGHDTLATLLAEHPSIIVQDSTAASAVEATSAIDPAPRLIIDACAGRGTKTRQLARLHPSAEIIATDIDADRLKSLRDSFAGHERMRIVAHTSLLDFVGEADLIVLDVPCSNSGVLARRVEAKYRFSPASLKSLVDLQRQIVADSLRLAANKASILYTTCSIDPAENQQQAAWLTQWHPYTNDSQESRMPVGAPGDDAARYRDGGYWALLRRR